MIDIELIRTNQKLVKDNIKRKFQDEKLPLIDEAVKLDSEIRKLKTEAQELRTERNTLSLRINEAKKAGKDVRSILEKAKKIPDRIKVLEDEEMKLTNVLVSIMSKIPNIISKHTPSGKDASQNKEIKKAGKIPKFSFPVKTHVELAESLGVADFEASARSSGKGFYYLKGDLALLNQALIRFGIDFMSKKKYDYIEVPLMLNQKSIYASMDKAAIEQSVYSVKDEDLNMIGTSEQSILAMHSDETIPESELPKKYFSYSMCFRKEIGAHGINEKGLWRTHQFNKIEQFIFCKPEDSEKLYEELLKNSEEILDKLDLPYRVLEICSGDLADWKHRSADLEVYRPTIKEYGEVMSLSNCTDYQARKLNIKVLDNKGNKRVLHTLNDTAIATSRLMVAILENNQNKDGSVTIPKVLIPYMNGKTKITRGG